MSETGLWVPVQLGQREPPTLGGDGGMGSGKRYHLSSGKGDHPSSGKGNHFGVVRQAA